MPYAPTISKQPPKKRLALFLDGTWNSVSDNTNVWRLKSLCSEQSDDQSSQAIYYDIGVNGLVGGLVGKGLSKNVVEAYEWLIESYNPDDDIFIFGFSRGAYTARSLAGLIAKYGLLKRGAPLGVKQLYQRYRRAEDRTIWKLIESRDSGTLGECNLEEQWMLKYCLPIHIKVVAVWDTVGSLGIPFGNVSGISRATLGFLHTGLRVPIENGFHALAIDEHRRSFMPTFWTVRTPKDPNAIVPKPRSLTSVEQRWFVGAHANVGGGCESDLLTQIPLKWIMRKASVHGLTFRNDVEIDSQVHKSPISDSYSEFMYGCYRGVSRRHHRPIGQLPIEREDGTHSNVNETIDASVFDRWCKVPEYRPPNLVDWANRHKVDIATLDKSVRADDPRTAAPD
jgi:uncharacterized protein (DUF2235 family)